MPTHTYLIRHGQSTFNERLAATGIDPMHFDARLTLKGRAQVIAAKEAAQQLAVELVVVSPLTRAIETGLGLFNPDQTPIIVSPLHRERLGNSCDVGRRPDELAVEFPMLDFSHLDELWWHDGPKDCRGIALEPDEAIFARMEEFSRWLMQRPEQRLAVIGHGTFFHRLTGSRFENCEMLQWDLQCRDMGRDRARDASDAERE